MKRGKNKKEGKKLKIIKDTEIEKEVKNVFETVVARYRPCKYLFPTEKKLMEYVKNSSEEVLLEAIEKAKFLMKNKNNFDVAFFFKSVCEKLGKENIEKFRKRDICEILNEIIGGMTAKKEQLIYYNKNKSNIINLFKSVCEELGKENIEKLDGGQIFKIFRSIIHHNLQLLRTSKGYNEGLYFWSLWYDIFDQITDDYILRKLEKYCEISGKNKNFYFYFLTLNLKEIKKTLDYKLERYEKIDYMRRKKDFKAFYDSYCQSSFVFEECDEDFKKACKKLFGENIEKTPEKIYPYLLPFRSEDVIKKFNITELEEVCEILGENACKKFCSLAIMSKLDVILELNGIEAFKRACKILGESVFKKLNFDDKFILKKIIEKYGIKEFKEFFNLIRKGNIKKLEGSYVGQILNLAKDKLETKEFEEVWEILGKGNIKKLEGCGSSFEHILYNGDANFAEILLHRAKNNLDPHKFNLILYHIMLNLETTGNNLLKDKNNFLDSNQKTMCEEFRKFLQQRKKSEQTNKKDFRTLITKNEISKNELVKIFNKKRLKKDQNLIMI